MKWVKAQKAAALSTKGHPPKRKRGVTSLGMSEESTHLDPLSEAKRPKAEDDHSKIYKPLKSWEIRLFTMESADTPMAPEDIRISIASYNTTSAPRYSALSYCWGKPSSQDSLFANGHQLPITSNLNHALRRLRTVQKRDGISHWWVDAICINQANLVERALQVMLMREIFRLASSVVVWLGEPENTQENVLESIKALENYAKEAKDGQSAPIPPAEAISSHLSGLSSFLSNNYFSRLWMVQETMAARRAVFYCGDAYEPWKTVTDVCKWISASGLVRLGSSELANDFARARSLLIQPGSPTLLHLLSRFRSLECSDDRDKVFALLTTSTELRDNYEILPNYTHSLPHVYTNICRFIIRRSRRLKVLSCVQKADRASGLPSWVPDWRRPWYYTVLDAFPGDDQSHRAFRSSKEKKVKLQSASTLTELNLQGILLDTVEGVYQPNQNDAESPSDTIQSFAEHMLAKLAIANPRDIYEPTKEFYTEALVRTMTTDTLMIPPLSSSDSAYAAPTYLTDDPALANLLRLTPRKVRPPQQTTAPQYTYEPWLDSVDDFHPTASDTSAIPARLTRLSDVFKYICTLCAGRQVFVTREGYLGLGPEEARVGDAVHVLLGADVPFVLRASDGDDKYTLVGECYVHGFMDGEAIDHMKREDHFQEVILT